MEELGNYLKEARLSLNLSIDKIVEETHIMRKFIDAIENEQFNVFPGEAYLKGFLRTYSEFLGLDPNDVVKRYERIKLAESPLPMEELIPKPSFDFKPIVVFFTFLLIIGAIGFGVVFLFLNISKNIANKSTDKSNTEVTIKKEIVKKEIKKSDEMVYLLTERQKDMVLKKGDSVEFNIGVEKYYIKIKEINPTVIVSDSKGKEYFLIKSYQQRFDVNNDNSNDIEITLNSWDNKVANVTFKLNIKDESIVEKSNDKVTENIVTTQGEESEVIAKKNVLEGINFVINVQNETFLRYQIDDLNYLEGYYKTGATLNIESQKNVTLWLSNAGAVSLNFKSFDKTITPGDQGKIEVKNIKWVQNSHGEYELQIVNLN